MTKEFIQIPSEVHYSNAQSGNWVAAIAGFEDVVFKLKSFTIPSITVGQSDIGGKSQNISLQVPGDHIIQDELSFDFFIDSNFRNYMKILRWLKYNSKVDQPLFADVTIMLLDGTGRPQGVDILFRNAWVMSLSPVLLDVENSDTDMFTNAIMKYEEFDFIDDEDFGYTSPVQHIV